MLCKNVDRHHTVHVGAYLFCVDDSSLLSVGIHLKTRCKGTIMCANDIGTYVYKVTHVVYDIQYAIHQAYWKIMANAQP